MKKEFNQKLVIIHGVENGGKSILFNLFKKDPSYICLDVLIHHYEAWYKQEITEQIGKENALQLKSAMKGEAIFEPTIFLKEIGSLMKKFPEYNFAIKPGTTEWASKQKSGDLEWKENVKKYTPVTDHQNIYHLFIMRHPKISWITINRQETYGFHKFMELWGAEGLIGCMKHHTVLKVEEFKNSKLLKNLLKNVDLNEAKTWSEFDLVCKENNSYKNLEYEFKRIEKELNHLFEYLNYGYNDVDDDMRDFLECQPNSITGII